MKNKIIIVLTIGILIRLILAFSTFHSDIQPFFFAGQVISKGNTLNFYDYLKMLPKDDPILRIYPTYLFNFPPAVYFFLGPLTHILTLPFNPSLLSDFLFDITTRLGDIQLNLLLLTLKLPYLPFDLASGFLLYKFFKNSKEGFLAFCFWIFNPFNLYATYMIGAFDVIPTFFTIFTLYLLTKRADVAKTTLIPEAVVLGIGAAFKIYPLLFLFPLSLLKRNWLDRLKIISVGILTYIVSIAPFISSHGFRATALVAGQTMKSLYSKIDISGGEAILLFPLFLIFFYFLFLYSNPLPEFLWKKFFIILLLFFIFTHYHPQWFLWITPLLIIDLVKTNPRHVSLLVLIFVSYIGLLTFFDSGLTIKLFSPLAPRLNLSPGIWQILKLSPDQFLFRSLFQTLFVSIGLYYIYYYFPKRE